MQGLTIHQPWASLLATGNKKFETRDWKRSYRGLLAIHAGKQSIPVEDYPLGLTEVLEDLGITDLQQTKGKIIAVGNLGKIHLMTDEFIKEQSSLERMTGYWEPGRFAWELTNIQELSKPIPFRGMPGLFEIPEATETEILNQLQLFQCGSCDNFLPWSQGSDVGDFSLCDECWNAIQGNL